MTHPFIQPGGAPNNVCPYCFQPVAALKWHRQHLVDCRAERVARMQHHSDLAKQSRIRNETPDWTEQ